jgi:DNA-binding transcriptional regulator YhcF (GntR family)
MSYKFQRLREKIRRAVQAGELAGKLPGERELARRFRVNAKTLSKALTDLAAEGLLHRSIGRGTFVSSADGSETRAAGPWLLLVDAEADQSVIQQLRIQNPRAQMSDDIASLRPSYLSQFSAVIDLAAQTPQWLLRDLLVRNIPVVAVGREPRVYSTNAVLLDTHLGVSQLTRDLALGGHRRFLAVETSNHNAVADAIRQAAGRYCPDFCVDPCSAEDIVCALEHGATAAICATAGLAVQTLRNLAAADISVPQQISVAAVGWDDGEYPCTGYFVAASQQAETVAELLHQGQGSRPATLWLAGKMIDRGTVGHVPPADAGRAIATALIA